MGRAVGVPGHGFNWAADPWCFALTSTNPAREIRQSQWRYRLALNDLHLYNSPMKKVIAALIAGISIMAVAACGGSSEPEPLPTATPMPTATLMPAATPMPTVTPAPAPSVTRLASLGEKVANCLEEKIGKNAAEAALSNLIDPTPEQEAALDECLLTASLGGGQSANAEVLACLTERLGGAVARFVASGLLPLTDAESVILGDCVLTVSAAAPGETSSPIVACLEEEMDADLARAVASLAVPLTAEQEVILGMCVLSVSLGSGTALLSGVVACLEGPLGVESARVVASGTASLTREQQAALGACLLGSTSEADTGGVTPEVFACLVEELGTDVAKVVASSVVPLNAKEGQILGECVLKELLRPPP